MRFACRPQSILTGSLLLLALLTPGAAGAGTFILPHFIEKSGTVSSGVATFDTNLYATHAGGLVGTPNSGAGWIHLYLFDDSTDAPMQGLSGDICNPCSYRLNATTRSRVIQFGTPIEAAGGFSSSSTRRGYAVVQTTGDIASLNLSAELALSNGADKGEFDRSGLALQEIGAQSAHTLVIPDLVETSRSAATSTDAIDTTLFVTYGRGLVGTGPGTAAAVDFYLFDAATSQPLLAKGGAQVCNPCHYDLSTAARKVQIKLEALINTAGGFAKATARGFGVIVVSGDDPNGVSFQGWMLKSHTSPFDVSVFDFLPQPLKAAE
jgi:hypothetical protein